MCLLWATVHTITCCSARKLHTVCREQTKRNRDREIGCNELFINTENVSGGREAGGIVNNPAQVGNTQQPSDTDMIS